MLVRMPRYGTRRVRGDAWLRFSLLLPVAAALGVVACADEQTDSSGAKSGLDRDTIGRYLLGDEQGALRIVDVASGRVEDTLELGAPAKLYGTGDGRHLLARVDELEFVTFVDAGVSYTDHIDHDHVRLDDVDRLPLDLSGRRPGAVRSHQGKTAVHFDGGPGEMPFVAAMSRADFDESDFGPQTMETTAEAPVSGLAMPFAGFLLVSDGADGEPARPTGFRVTDFAGMTYGTFGDVCPGLRDAAPAPDSPRALVACDDELLAVESLGGAMFELVALDGAAEGAGVDRFVWHGELPFVLGLADGGRRRVWIDAGELEVQADSGADVVFAGVAARADPDGVILVTGDGAVERARGVGELEAVAPAGTVPVAELGDAAADGIVLGYDMLFFLAPQETGATVVEAVRLGDGQRLTALELPGASATSLALSGPARVPLGDMGFDDL